MVALVLAILPVAFALSLPFLGMGAHHLPDSIVYANRSALFIAVLFSVVSLALSARTLQVKGLSSLPALTAVLAAGFLVWATPLVYGVVAAMVCGAC